MVEPGFVRGKHFTKYVETVKTVKRRGDFPALETLLLELVDATEAESRAEGWGVAPWYYEELANLYKKQDQPQKELAILERYDGQKKAPGALPPKLAERLAKLRKRLGEGGA